MFFTLSKIFWTLAQPLNAICLLALAGLIIGLKWRKTGRRLAGTALILLLVFGILPVGPVLMVWMEKQYPTPTALPDRIDGIILLGGAFETALSKKNGQITANDNIERVFCFLDIAKKYPDAKRVFSGGPGDIVNQDAMEGDDVRAFFKLAGLTGRNVIYEEKSRNTYENALYSKEIVKPAAGENWVLMTSAYHMPRSVGIFEKQDWPVIPYACDQKTDGTYTSAIKRLPSVTGNFHLLNLVLKEMIGSVIYYATGKTAFILPPAPIPSGNDKAS